MSEPHDDETLRELWRQLPPEKAPSSLVVDLESTLRQKGFLQDKRPWLWGIAGALVLGGGVSYWAFRKLEPPTPETILIPVTVEMLHQAASPLSFSGRLLSDYGRFTPTNDPTLMQPWRDFEGEVPQARLKDLEVEISLYPHMRLLEATPQGESVHVVVRVREAKPEQPRP